MLDCFISLFLSTFSSFVWNENFQKSPHCGFLMISELVRLKRCLSDYHHGPNYCDLSCHNDYK